MKTKLSPKKTYGIISWFCKILNLNLTSAILLAVIFFLIYSVESINRHLSYNSNAFDLGIFTQAVYLYSNGKLAFSSITHLPMLADHFELILWALSPVYKLFPNPILLLIIQALFVAISSIPLFMVAYDRLKNNTLAFLLQLAFLSSGAISNAILFDFHTTTISILPLALMITGYNFKKWSLFWGSAFLSLLFKEDNAVFIFGFGLYLLLVEKEKIKALMAMILGATGFYLIKFIIMPIFSPLGATSHIADSVLPLNSPLELLLMHYYRPTILIDQLFNSLIKINTLNELFKEFGYFSIVSPFTWLVAFPNLYLRFTSSVPLHWGTAFHYNSNLTPFILMGTILAISKFKIPSRVVIIILVFVLLTSSLNPYYSSVWNIFSTDNFDATKYVYLNQSLDQIPIQARISAQSTITPHLANREKIYMFPDIYDADYIILDRQLNIWPMNQKEYQNKINLLARSTKWKLQFKNQTLVVYKKVSPTAFNQI